jgi:DMSO/TMAO reductase YedYZ molybdopterin-dependent catalytic subunit
MRTVTDRRRGITWSGLLAGAVCGVLAAAVALGVAQLVAGITGALGSPIDAIGAVAINHTPIPVKEYAIAHFGSRDKDALVTGILALLLVAAAVAGVLARRRLAYGLAVLAAFGVAGVAAAVSQPSTTWTDALPTLAGMAAAAGALVLLTRSGRSAFSSRSPRVIAGPSAAGEGTAPHGRAADAWQPANTGLPAPAASSLSPAEPEVRSDRDEDPAVPADPQAPAEPELPAPEAPRPPALPWPPSSPALPAKPESPVLHWPPPAGSEPSPGSSRRRFLLTGAGVAAVAAAGAGGGQLLLGRFSVASSRAAVRLPAPAVAARPVPAGAQLKIGGLSPFFTPNQQFYRVDTDLVVPQVAPDSWKLRIDGMVSRPVEISFDQLLRMPLTENDMTLVCVSNVVGGPYAGNARWLGVPLATLLRRAGVKAGADQVLSTGTDGMTISTPIQAILDGRDALVAVGMNGQALPVAHGFPARMVVPGFYGYVSATKWLTRLTVTTFASRQAYWTQRGYAVEAPIKTESRIDVPKPLAQVTAGRTAVAGVAWAPHRGVEAVEVSVDNGLWHQATLAAADGIDTWRQWVWTWDATTGLHSLRVRATDGTGATQTGQEASPVPNGASGWDSVVVTVT